LRLIPFESILDVLTMPDTKGLVKALSGTSSVPSTPQGAGPLSPRPVHPDPSGSPTMEPACFQVVIPGKTYQFGTELREDMIQWVRELRRLINHPRT
jgi:hypothetical protein